MFKYRGLIFGGALGFILTFIILSILTVETFARQTTFVTVRSEFLGFNPIAGISLAEANSFEYRIYKDGSVSGQVVSVGCLAGTPIECRTVDNIGLLFPGAADGSQHTATISNALVLSSGGRGPETTTAICNFLLGRNPGAPLNLRPVK